MKTIINKFGENGHLEYNWSNNIQEKIVQFNFQVTSSYNSSKINELSIILESLIFSLKSIIDTGSSFEKQLAKGHLGLLYKMIGHTRDIIDGKGEYTLSYMMIYVWNKIYPHLAEFALKCFVNLNINNKNIHPYGSWKDIKYLCEYCKGQGENINSNLIQYSINIVNKQLNEDYINLISNYDDLSLVSKWVPRDKSKYCWLYESLAVNYFSFYIETAKNENNMKKAILKCKTEYRMILSTLNRKLDTLQIKQCNNEWSNINFDNVTSISLTKQKKAFFNINKDGTPRYPENIDRNICAENFKTHIQKSIKGEIEMKGKRLSVCDFTKQALQLLHSDCNKLEKELLNSQWRDNSSQNKMLGKMIAMVDVSSSMEGNPMYAAIGLGLRIAEKSILGKRIMTFGSKPEWINLEHYNDFVSQVEIVKNAPWGMNTNFYSALNMILDAIIENKMSPEDVQDIVLVILSDMQIERCDSCYKQTLYEIMKIKYEEAGIRVHGKPYKPPHILFWNLRSTNGFPCLSNQPNTSMMSGFSTVLLNLFCEEGIDALHSCTPWSILIKSLENERYKILGNKFEEFFV